MKRFPFYEQPNIMDCGPTCLKMVAKYYGKNISLNTLKQATQINREGVSMLGISDAAEQIGFKTRGVKIRYEQLINEVTLPVVLHWQQNHFVVLPDQKFNKKNITIADPAKGVISIAIDDFKRNWISSLHDEENVGIVLLIEPTSRFYEQEGEKSNEVGWGTLFNYFWAFRKQLVQLVIGLFAGSLLQLIFPFLTQSIVDTGIRTHNLQFIYIILIGQFTLLFSRVIVEFIRSRILLFVSTHINISILSDFWIKLMRLSLSFFDTTHTGDILQRISDHRRIEQFLTGSALSTLFSAISFFMLSIVLLLYNWKVYFVFCTGSILYFLWIRLFLKQRRKLDYKNFDISSKENAATMQLVQGMHEIKLNNAEQVRRWEWEGYQAAHFKLSFKSLSLSQYQQTGAFFINEGKNILVTLFVAKAVVSGQLTLGTMLAIQSILGQLSSPIEQFISFIQQAQDAKISLERLNAIHRVEDEEPVYKEFINYLPENTFLNISNLSFTYTGTDNEPVLRNINLHIPEGKVTAIVGMSGSGKTTLLKLLLRFYDHYKGDIKIGNSELRRISPSFWRSQCGSVMQDGYIFNDSIARNIAVKEENPNYERLLDACRTANILDFVESLPLGFGTKIGVNGTGISAGQKQRILIARAVYKNPCYLFFDEATNALDSNNEKVIMENLQAFFNNRTVIVVAHRLSTVKNADNIVLLQNGEIAEQGTHEELSMKKGKYYQLVKNQLELGL